MAPSSQSNVDRSWLHRLKNILQSNKDESVHALNNEIQKTTPLIAKSRITLRGSANHEVRGKENSTRDSSSSQVQEVPKEALWKNMTLQSLLKKVRHSTHTVNQGHYPVALHDASKKAAIRRVFESNLASTKEQLTEASRALLNEVAIKAQVGKDVLNEAARSSAQTSKQLLNEAAKTSVQFSKDAVRKATSSVETQVHATYDASKQALNQVQTSITSKAEEIRAKPDQLIQSIRIAREDLALRTARRAKQARNFAVFMVVSGCFAFGLGLGLGAGGVRRKIED